MPYEVADSLVICDGDVLEKPGFLSSFWTGRGILAYEEISGTVQRYNYCFNSPIAE
jgi:hypothetical protein